MQRFVRVWFEEGESIKTSEAKLVLPHMQGPNSRFWNDDAEQGLEAETKGEEAKVDVATTQEFESCKDIQRTEMDHCASCIRDEETKDATGERNGACADARTSIGAHCITRGS